MTNRQELIVKNVDAHKQLVLDAERWLWAHPQTGYTEWEAHNYLVEKFEALGYKLNLAGNIPGFWVDVETGKPGPKLAIFGELDALDIANHPESVNGMTHCCGHHGQVSALLGIAAALTEPGALDGLSGSIRLIAVPAEEMIQLEFREGLRKQGIIKYNGGKVEFMHRGILDGCDIAMMVHGGNLGDNFDFGGSYGSNGCMAKTIKFKGKSSHAGGAPHMGVNAQYAAMLGLQACNDLRETLQEKDYIRFHPIMMGVNCAVNIIPDEMKIESYVRGSSLEAIKRENKKFNRALTGAALALGAGVELCDRPGYAPEIHDPDYMKLIEQCCADLVGAERVMFDYTRWGTGSSDFGDITCVMPGVQFSCAGASGTGHGIDYYITDANRLCVNSAKAQLFVADALLCNDAEAAKKIIANYKPQFNSIPEYLKAIDEISLDKDAVVYDENGNATVDFQNI
ncbi:MAG: amidohydrolase [Clostridia bacterium]|nr:amidohydrolase [Clostridia bacterium]